MTDGTVYELALGTCDTSGTNPSALPLANGHDVFGSTADGVFELDLGRGGFTDDESVAAGSIEGDVDGTGEILYSASTESLNQLVVDGANLSGGLDFKAIGPVGPHGAEASGTVEVRC